MSTVPPPGLIRRGKVQPETSQVPGSYPALCVIRKPSAVALIRSMITFTVQCEDSLGNDRSALVQWSHDGAPDAVAAVGNVYHYSVDRLGEQFITATYTDPHGATIAHRVRLFAASEWGQNA